MKEYTIFVTCKGGKPYSLLTYNNFYDAKLKLFDMINLERERNRPYYVFNDFYENEYPASLSCKRGYYYFIFFQQLTLRKR